MATKLLLDAVAATTIAAALVCLGGLALRRAPAALRHSLWRTALLTFWVVPLAAIAVDLLGLQVSPIRMPTISSHTRDARADRIGGRYGESPFSSAAAPSADSAGRTPAAPSPALPRPAPLTLALLAWAAGLAFSAICLGRKFRSLRRLLRGSSPIEDATLRHRVSRWSARVGLPHPPALAQSPDVTVPTVAGWRCALLLLPPGFSTEDAGCDAILVHELAHVARRDLPAHAIARATRALWWWHPLSWLAMKELAVTAEEACDDWAISLTAAPRGYADHIVRWAEIGRAGGTLACACRGKDLSRRVRRLLAQTSTPQLHPTSRARTALAVCALGAMLAAAVLRAQPPPMIESTSQEEETVSTPDRTQGTEVLPDELVQLAGRKFADSLGDGYIYQAGLPTAYVQALNHAGVDIDFADFAAMSGWAFSFGYTYGDFSTAFLAVRGSPGGDGPYEAFQIAEWFGLGYESALTEEKDDLWAFVQKHIDAGTPILSEHYDGGLICGYRQNAGKREVWFAVDPPTGEPAWVDINDLHPYEVCVLVEQGDPLPKRELYLNALQRALKYAAAHDSGGVPQGLAALEAYAVDVADPGKDFANCGEYFCWATFERLMARRCAAVWLQRAAQELDQSFELGAAVARYQRAYELYDEYRRAIGAGDPNSGVTREQLRSPEKIEQAVPLLQHAINEERAGLHEIAVGLAGQGLEPPATDG